MKRIYILTGGIASGKSTISNMFKEHHYFVIDCDRIVNALYQSNRLTEEISSNFGSEYIVDGVVDRKKLGNLIFKDEAARARINSIIHPMVFEEIESQKVLAKDEVIIIDMPLFFEVNYRNYDKVICVYSDLDTRVQRLMNRDNIDREYALAKINSQMSLDLKKSKSDYVIDNSNSLEESNKQFLELLKQL